MNNIQKFRLSWKRKILKMFFLHFYIIGDNLSNFVYGALLKYRKYHMTYFQYRKCYFEWNINFIKRIQNNYGVHTFVKPCKGKINAKHSVSYKKHVLGHINKAHHFRSIWSRITAIQCTNKCNQLSHANRNLTNFFWMCLKTNYRCHTINVQLSNMLYCTLKTILWQSKSIFTN